MSFIFRKTKKSVNIFWAYFENATTLQVVFRDLVLTNLAALLYRFNNLITTLNEYNLLFFNIVSHSRVLEQAWSHRHSPQDGPGKHCGRRNIKHFDADVCGMFTWMVFNMMMPGLQHWARNALSARKHSRCKGNLTQQILLHYRRCQRCHHKKWWPWLRYLHQGNMSGAVAHYRSALQLEPTYPHGNHHHHHHHHPHLSALKQMQLSPTPEITTVQSSYLYSSIFVIIIIRSCSTAHTKLLSEGGDWRKELDKNN